MILCSCDPDCRTPAFAVFDGLRLMKWKLLNAGRTGHIDRLFPSIREIIEAFRPELLVIENQYLPSGPEAARRFKPVSQLVAARGMITAIFVISNVDYRLVEPFAWQKSLGGADLGREQLKRRSVLKASDIAGEAIQNHNVADAINMGFWFVKRSRLSIKAAECIR
jgi:Holliday junction resolvasome RuvABC endonuclease subunit